MCGAPVTLAAPSYPHCPMGAAQSRRLLSGARADLKSMGSFVVGDETVLQTGVELRHGYQR